MAAQEGQCPTCGKTITIPILDRYGRLIDPKTRQIIKQDPHPVHAYAAAGDRAPLILRQPGGTQNIQCPRCQSISPITANNCKACGMPFTMEGTTLEASGASNGFCVTSLVLGIIGIPAFCTVVTPILAIIFGIIGYNQASKADVPSSGKGMAIAGIILGVIGCIVGRWRFFGDCPFIQHWVFDVECSMFGRSKCEHRTFNIEHRMMNQGERFASAFSSASGFRM